MAAAMFTTVVPLGIVWDAKTKLLFVHIPKSAGMSIELAMGEAMLTRVRSLTSLPPMYGWYNDITNDGQMLVV